MPWVENENGREYVISAFAKEELPTWNEMYECYTSGLSLYDPKDPDDQMLDPYWKITRKKYLIAIQTNQFNKMLFEDGMMDEAIECIAPLFLKMFRNKSARIVHIRFECHCRGWDIDFGVTWPYNNTAREGKYLIYTIPHPMGTPNPFIINKGIPRADISKLHEILYLHPVIVFADTSDRGLLYEVHIGRLGTDNIAIRNALIDLLMNNIKRYFSGPGVGWKDADGNLIDSDTNPTKCNSGSDPAL